MSVQIRLGARRIGEPMNLALLDEGFIVGLITALRSEDPIRYCEHLELRNRVEEILQTENWDAQKIIYWLNWFRDFF